MNIKDIAKLAGVGSTTVSRVINNQSDVSEATRNKVLDIIKKYNYIPNNSARSLKSTSSKIIGVLVDGRYNQFYYEIINIIGNKVQELGYSMILKNNHNSLTDIGAAREFILEKRLVGLICIGLDFIKVEEKEFKQIDIPLVLVSSNISKDISQKLYSSIDIDDFKSAYDAVTMLIKKGHSKIAIITAKGDKGFCADLRLQGYKEALKENNISINLDFIEYGTYCFESGYDAMKRIVKNKATAVFVISDIMAIGAARLCAEENIVIPDDISIIGFDGINYSEYYSPAIGTVKQPYEEMSLKCVDLIIGLIDKKEEGKHIIFDTKVIERESIKNFI